MVVVVRHEPAVTRSGDARCSLAATPDPTAITSLPGVTVVGPRRTLPSRMMTRSNTTSTSIRPTHTPSTAHPIGGISFGLSHRTDSAMRCDTKPPVMSGHMGQPTATRSQTVDVTNDTAQPASAHFWCRDILGCGLFVHAFNYNESGADLSSL